MEREGMRVIVPIKQILDPEGITIRRDKERLFVNREEYVIEPASQAALEAALCLKDGLETEVEIVALSMGPPRADDALREALAMGCDSARLLTDDAFERADVSVTTRVLAAAIEKLGGGELIVTGRESGDTGAGQLGPRLAQALGYAPLSDVCALAATEGVLQATRRWGDAYATVQADMPAVVSVAAEAFLARYAHGARIMNAYREWDVSVWGARDLNLSNVDLEPLLVARGESFPPPLEVGESLRGDPTDVAADIVTALRIQRLVA
jgi:electron transfer flavoprotein beta subunit